MDQKRINEIRARCMTWLDESADSDTINDAEIGLQTDLPDLLDALEEAQSETEHQKKLVERATDEAARWADFAAEREAEVERLREALRKVEKYAMRNVQAGIREDNSVIRTDECRFCRARFHSWLQGEPHADNCPFKILEETDVDKK